VLRLRAELAQLSRQVTRDRADTEALPVAVDTVDRSTTWRVTAPLRALGGLLKRPEA